MEKTYKLFEILLVLDEKAVRQVRKMLRSPFFAYRDGLQLLFETALKYLKKKQIQPSLAQLHLHTFPGQDFEATRIRGLMSDLLELLEEWLLIHHWRQDPIGSRLTLSAIYRQKQLEKSFQSSIRKSSRLLQSYPLRNQDYYRWTLQLHEEKMIHQSASRRTEDLYFQEISENTDITFLIRKLKNACSLLTHQSVYKTEYDFGLLDFFIDHIEESAYMEVPAVAVYYYCFRFLQEEDSLTYFQQFKHTLTQHRQQFATEDLKGAFLLGINFCIKQLNKGFRAYAREGLELYKEGIAQDILLENNQITRFTYNNIVAMALFLKDFDWLHHFIDTESDHLEPSYKQATISFNKARLAFAQKAFGQALVHLQSAEYKDLVNNLISKLLLVQIYYELEEVSSLESHLDSFQQFIRRREVSDYHRRNFMNIIGYVRRLMAIPAYDKGKRAELRAQIEAEQVLSVRDWLLAKI
ncbi:MAG: hypothetical protein AAFP19_13880 [Bacteroidota bacterium]